MIALSILLSTTREDWKQAGALIAILAAIYCAVPIVQGMVK